jgi:TolB protein
MKAHRALFVAVLLAGIARAAPVGNFTDVNDIGDVGRATEASYDPGTGSYTVGASGDDIWSGRDAFGFVWKQARGDVALAARIELKGKSVQEHRKAGLMLRQSLDPNSAYVDLVVHGDGLTSLQFRSVTGGPTREIQCAREAPAAARLEKRGDHVLLLLANDSGRFDPTACSIKLPLIGSYYAGLAVCAHDNHAFETAKFRFVSLGLLPPRSEKRLSAIEVIALDSLDRRVVYQSESRLDSPSFTANGNAVCFREDGELRYFSLTANADAHRVGIENVEECRLAPPVQSPWQLSQRVTKGRTQLFRGESGKEKALQLTRDSYSSWTPRLSPDGLAIAFISGDKQASGDYLLREVSVGGGPPRELAQFFGGSGPLGLSPWSADGKQLVFASREPD